MSLRVLLLLSCFQLSVCPVALAAIVDFTTWTEVADPVDANFSASSTSTTATLQAGNAPITSGTDIGFQSVDGPMPRSSTQGYFFDPHSDFTIAIDYALTFGSGSMGFLGLGFGIGEDQQGMNSAGVAMATFNGSPLLTFGGAARVDDQPKSPLMLGATPPTLVGSLFVEYDAASGDVTVGAATTQNATAPTVSGTYSNIQNEWNNENLLASFFIRSDGSGWQGGNAEAIFENFRIIEGTATSVPEPSGVASVGLAGVLIVRSIGRRRRRRRDAAAVSAVPRSGSSSEL